MTPPKNNLVERPPVVAIMGHVDHGKSSLLDYIRKSNIVAGEAGGITQHIAAYEVVHNDANNIPKKITFIDTPGHAAFSNIRNRGAQIADIAILIVSAEESVKPQTVEAIKCILNKKVPYIVAITKIDKNNANIEKVKSDLLNEGVYVEGFGGDIPCVPISSKTGEGIASLLETILLLAEFQEFTGDPTLPATGFVAEANLDTKRGVSATLIIKNGTLQKGQFVVVESIVAGTRIIEDFTGTSIESATFSSPIIITGFSGVPTVGATFQTYDSKKEAEASALSYESQQQEAAPAATITDDTKIVPVIIKADVFGSAEAVASEINKLSTPEVYFKVIRKDVGAINESDAQLALSDKNTIIIGFNVDIEKRVPDMNDIETITIKTFNIIYKMSEWLEEERAALRPKKEVDTILGQLKIIKIFSETKNGYLLGGKVIEGSLKVKTQFKLFRNNEEVARGHITDLQLAKSPVETVDQGNECGVMVECSKEPQSGDIIATFLREVK